MFRFFFRRDLERLQKGAESIELCHVLSRRFLPPRSVKTNRPPRNDPAWKKAQSGDSRAGYYRSRYPAILFVQDEAMEAEY